MTKLDRARRYLIYADGNSSPHTDTKDHSEMLKITQKLVTEGREYRVTVLSASKET